jgi:hypothetical protein
LGPALTHRETPVEHDVFPRAQPSGAVHVEFSVQFEQLPLLHTWPAPQDFPFGALVAVSLHVCPVAEHTMVPMWHALPSGVHKAPWLHTMMVARSLFVASCTLVATTTSCPVPLGAV